MIKFNFVLVNYNHCKKNGINHLLNMTYLIRENNYAYNKNILNKI